MSSRMIPKPSFNLSMALMGQGFRESKILNRIMFNMKAAISMEGVEIWNRSDKFENMIKG